MKRMTFDSISILISISIFFDGNICIEFITIVLFYFEKKEISICLLHMCVIRTVDFMDFF